jgi:hypothetical protein
VHLHSPVVEASTITVMTTTAGLLSSWGRGLWLAAADWRGSASTDGRTFTVEVAVPVQRLRVEGLVLEGAVSALERTSREEVERAIASTLHATRFAEARWSGRGTLPDGGSGEVRADGQLTLRGVTRALPVTARLEQQGTDIIATGDVTFLQTTFGVKPYSALLGALRVADEVRVAWRVTYRRRG